MPVSKRLKKRILEALACSSDKCLSRKKLQERVNVSLDTQYDLNNQEKNGNLNHNQLVINFSFL